MVGLKKQRHTVLVFLVLLAILTFLDRLCIAVAGPRMQADLGISTEHWGWVLGAFVLSYGLFEIPTGIMGDRSGQRSTLTRVVLWWSVFTSLTGAASNLWVLIAIRFLFGAGEAGAYPNMAGVVARWFPIRERAQAQGFIWGASRFGGALAPLTVVPIQMALGWRASFWIFGALGMVWCVAFWRWFRDTPAQHPGVTPAELAEVKGAVAGAGHSMDWGVLLRSGQMWIILIMYGSYAWGSWFYFSWLHTYLVKARGFAESEMAIASSLPFLLGAVANIVGGRLSDHAVRIYGARRGRTLIGSVCLSVSAVLLMATAFTSGKLAAVALLTISFGVMDLMLPSAWALCVDIGGEHTGAVTGAMNASGQLGGFFCTVIFGYVSAYFQSLHAPLLVIGCMLLFSAAMFWQIDPTRPLFEKKEH
ncbi:MAG: MFS transporter [Bryobacterales bacterium]|nr:MFS transporter [Bryobacterales bacterium]